MNFFLMAELYALWGLHYVVMLIQIQQVINETEGDN